MHVRPSRLAMQLMLCLLVLLPVVVIQPNAAQATVQHAGWPQSLEDTSPSNLVTHLDGSVTAGNCSSNADKYAVKTFRPNGVVAGGITETDYSVSQVRSCQTATATGKDGTLYAVRSQPYGNNAQKYYLVGFKGATQTGVFELKSPDCPNYWELPQQIQIGADGRVYVSLVNCQGYSLAGFTADLRTRVFHTAIGHGVFSTYSGGLILQEGNQIRYYNYSGQREIAKTYSIQLSANEFVQSYAATSYLGRAFVLVGIYNPITITCGLPQTSKRIIAVDPMAAPSNEVWRYTAPSCTRITDLDATPRNGVVFEQLPYLASQNIVALSNTGKKVWGQPYMPHAGTIDGLSHINEYGHDVIVDVNNTIMVAGQYSHINASGHGQFGYSFAFVDGDTGKERSWFTTKELGIDLSGPNGRMFAMARDRLYLGGCQIDPTTSGCISDSTNAMLYAVKVVGLSMDYPRGKLLGLATVPVTKLNYVALGDSFSSGEGVPEFEPPSDTNGCHRSKTAYPKLLNSSTANNWNLTKFVACSGATTADVINGKNGEPSQLNALSSSTRVVTISIGGNDVGFRDFVLECLGFRCDGNSAAYKNSIYDIDNKLPGNLTGTTPGNEGLLRRIKTKAPNAKIYVVGYPQLAPVSTEPHSWPWCDWIENESDHIAARDVVTRLNFRLQLAVKEMGAGFVFVDPNKTGSPFIGHELCDGNTYFNGTTFFPDYHYSMHPNRLGQEAYKHLIEQYS